MANPGPSPMDLTDFHCRFFTQDMGLFRAVAERKGISKTVLLREIVSRLLNPQSIVQYLSEQKDK